jgi:hypothetical protein
VRGDSRLDLYAKSLALLLLGLVGATGALFDYWPAPMSLPAVASPALGRLNPSIQTAFDLPGLMSPAPEAVRARLNRAATHASAVPDRHAQAAEPEPTTFAGEVGEDQILPSLPIQEGLTALETLPVDLSVPPAAEMWQPLTAPAVAATNPSDDGFFSGMLKKTGSSVSTSLGKASTSLIGAVRVVSDAVKKAF